MSIRLSRVDPTKNMARFYELDIQSGLFGDVCVTRHWGRIGANGQSKEHWLVSEANANEFASKLERQKRGRGYRGSRLIRAKSDDKQLIEFIREIANFTL